MLTDVKGADGAPRRVPTSLLDGEDGEQRLWLSPDADLLEFGDVKVMPHFLQAVRARKWVSSEDDR